MTPVLSQDWGKWKHDFRALNDGVAANLLANVKKAMAVLSRELRFKFSRKARSYKRAYRALRDGLNPAEYEDIEKAAKTVKTHRCCLDQQRSFIINA